MKTAIVFLVCIGVAAAQHGAGPAINTIGAGAAGGAAGGAAVGAPGAPAVPVNPYGPMVYGMGLNNRFAMPHNTYAVRRALALINRLAPKQALVRINADGEIDITNTFGQDVEITDAFGNELFDY